VERRGCGNPLLDLRLFSLDPAFVRLAETYPYDALSFCRPSSERPKTKWSGLGSVLQGNDFVDSQLELSFRSPTPVTAICEQTLSEAEADRLAGRIAQHYWYELFLDGLPVWGFVGPPPEHTDEPDARYVYTHKAFDIAYNGDRIIHVNLTSDNPTLVEAGAVLRWTYEVNWAETEVAFDDRFERYLDYSFFEHQCVLTLMSLTSQWRASCARSATVTFESSLAHPLTRSPACSSSSSSSGFTGSRCSIRS